jgi:RNA polymerase sigma-70 factor (ECF subfamily)
MRERDWLAERFEEQRPRLRAVAHRMLGSLSEADDALQESWLRLARSDAVAIENLDAWLTTVVARISLNMLRSRRARAEEPLDAEAAEPVAADEAEPEDEAVLVDSVGLALLVVLETLSPAERLAFVLHDMFGVPFEEIATILDRSPEAARQLASRGRRRVRGASPAPDPDPATQREVVNAFLAAARDGDFEALVAVLDPDVVLRAETAPGAVLEVRGAEAVASRAQSYAQLGLRVRPALVDGSLAWVSIQDGELFSVGAFTLRAGRIAELTFLADPERIGLLDIAFLDA